MAQCFVVVRDVVKSQSHADNALRAGQPRHRVLLVRVPLSWEPLSRQWKPLFCLIFVYAGVNKFLFIF